MRTTLRIDDDVLRAARSLANSEGKTVGQVVSELAREGLALRLEEATDGDLPMFSVPENATPIRLEMVRRAAENP